MTLTTHSLIAGTITKKIIFTHPIIGFFVAIISHYLSDAIPHWDYPIRSLDKKEGVSVDVRKWRYSKSFFLDFLRFAFDAILGLGILLLIFQPRSLRETLAVLIVVIGSVLPDFLQGLYLTRRFEFLQPVQRFHDLCHTKIKLGPYPILGVPFQLLIVSVTLLLLI